MEHRIEYRESPRAGWEHVANTRGSLAVAKIAALAVKRQQVWLGSRRCHVRVDGHIVRDIEPAALQVTA